MRFCSAINCMDGRVQLPVIRYLQDRFGAEHVDCISEAGPNLILAEAQPASAVDAILKRLAISVHQHGSVGVAVVGHHDCAGNPAPREEQLGHVERAIEFLHRHFEKIEIIGLWVDREWRVQEIA